MSTNTKFLELANEYIAQGALTNSKRPECLVKGVYPTHLKEGQGCFVYDHDQRTYVDFICGLGTNILGYNNPIHAVALNKAIKTGLCLSLPTDLELEASEKMQEYFPYMEKFKWVTTGTEACHAALRIARTYTGRTRVLSHGYHGWVDEYVSLTPPGLGCVGGDAHRLKDLSDITSDVAAVIIEPVILEEDPSYLADIRDACINSGALLIYDEVITGLRYPKHSVANSTKIIPHLSVMGKALGNGTPVGLVSGPADIMDCGEYFVSGTYAGNRLSMASVISVLDLLRDKYNIDQLIDEGNRFCRNFNKLHPDIQIEGYGTRGALKGNDELKALFMQEMCKAGYLFGPSFFINFAHLENGILDATFEVASQVLNKINMGLVKLEGEMPSSPFAAKSREN